MIRLVCAASCGTGGQGQTHPGKSGADWRFHHAFLGWAAASHAGEWRECLAACVRRHAGHEHGLWLGSNPECALAFALGRFDGLHPKWVVINIGTNNLSGTSHARANVPEEIVEGIVAFATKFTNDRRKAASC